MITSRLLYAGSLGVPSKSLSQPCQWQVQSFGPQFLMRAAANEEGSRQVGRPGSIGVTIQDY